MVCLCETKASLSLHKIPVKVSSSAPHLLYKEHSISPITLQMSSQGVMSWNEAGNNPGLCPAKWQWPGLSSRTRAINQFSSLSLRTNQIQIDGNTFNEKHISCNLLVLCIFRDDPSWRKHVMLIKFTVLLHVVLCNIFYLHSRTDKSTQYNVEQSHLISLTTKVSYSKPFTTCPT
jgi:hypothetical protein